MGSHDAARQGGEEGQKLLQKNKKKKKGKNPAVTPPGSRRRCDVGNVQRGVSLGSPTSARKGRGGSRERAGWHRDGGEGGGCPRRCVGDRFLALGEGQGSHYSSLPKVLAGVSPWEEQFARAVPLKSQCGVIITPVLSPFKLETTVLLGFCHRLSTNFAKCF